jgi:hypothetical protein
MQCQRTVTLVCQIDYAQSAIGGDEPCVQSIRVPIGVVPLQLCRLCVISIGTIPFHSGVYVEMVLMIHITISGVPTSYLVCMGKSAVLHAQETNKNNMSSRAAVFKKGLLFSITCNSGSGIRPSHAISEKQRLAPECIELCYGCIFARATALCGKAFVRKRPQVKFRCCFPPRTKA